MSRGNRSPGRPRGSRVLEDPVRVLLIVESKKLDALRSRAREHGLPTLLLIRQLLDEGMERLARKATVREATAGEGREARKAGEGRKRGT